jgi:hypothetical protein
MPNHLIEAVLIKRIILRSYETFFNVRFTSLEPVGPVKVELNYSPKIEVMGLRHI